MVERICAGAHRSDKLSYHHAPHQLAAPRRDKGTLPAAHMPSDGKLLKLNRLDMQALSLFFHF